MKVLVVGTGAREHVICESLKDDVELYSYMSNINPGIARISNYRQGSELDVQKVAEYSRDNNIEMVIIGPEAPLGRGIVDELEKYEIKSVGPDIDAARIETDKSFMRGLFEEYKIPGSLTFKVFDKYEDIDRFLDEYDGDVVVKPVGLTGGKGVKIVGDHLRDNDEAKTYAREIIDTKMGGFSQVIIEEKVVGEEFTVQAFSDGKNLSPMPAVQDHPHAFEGDDGPITGGMGSYSDKNGLLPFLTQKEYDDAVQIMDNTISAIKDKTFSYYKGVLYGQFMLTKNGPKLIEYNARFGDPEVMNTLPLMETPMIDVCNGIVDGKLKKVSFMDKASVCKYLVPDGYPETTYGNTLISVDEEKIDALGGHVYYAAVNQKEDGVYTSSSRAIGVVGIGETIFDGEKIAESSCRNVHGNLYHRRDIGKKELVDKRIKHINDIRT
ncbi:MAG: phosphoribosylamine--glycine ligase [Methanobrevibacter sp.]|jgi:phosphoribosylamine--glycine ligase|nr:phosphoribosylamine--glycine ligase [Candidatus Methanovirga aequatorialis]